MQEHKPVKFFAKTSNSARAVVLDAQTLESAKAEAWSLVTEQHAVGVIVFVVHDTGEREVVSEVVLFEYTSV